MGSLWDTYGPQSTFEYIMLWGSIAFLFVSWLMCHLKFKRLHKRVAHLRSEGYNAYIGYKSDLWTKNDLKKFRR